MERRGHIWREKRKALTRQMLLEAAQEVFVQRGYAATMGEMARHARCSPGLFYTYFPSKRALIEAIAMQHFNELFELAVTRIRTVDASTSCLREGLRVMACHVAERRTTFRLLIHAMPGWCEREVGTAGRAGSVMQEFVVLTSEILKECQRAGLVRTDVSVSELQAFIQLVCLGLIERIATAPTDPHAEELAALAWDLLYGGIQNEPRHNELEAPRNRGIHPAGLTGSERVCPVHTKQDGVEHEPLPQAVLGPGVPELHERIATFDNGRQAQTAMLNESIDHRAPAARMPPPCASPVGPHNDGHQGGNGGSLLFSPLNAITGAMPPHASNPGSYRRS